MNQLYMFFYMLILIFHINIETKYTKPHYKKINLIQMGSPPIQVYHAINKYANMYNVPFKIAYGIARKESSYNGPHDLNYTYLQTSKSGAEGAMQFMPSTIRLLTGNNKLTSNEIRRNVDMNVKYSMIYLNKLFIENGNWKISLGYYNTGHSIINDYVNDIL